MTTPPLAPDWIAETVAARARTLGLTPYAVAKRTNGAVSAKHLRAYLAGEQTLGSSRLQHVLDVLGLTLAPAPEPDAS